MRRRRLPVEVSDRLWGIAGVAIVIAGSVWGLLDAGQSPSTAARSSPAPSIPVSTASTLPLTATATVPPGTYPADLWLVDATGGSPIAITAVDENIPSWYDTISFEQQPYIMPGDDVWTTADWSRRP
jgi:hypothetical protein